MARQREIRAHQVGAATEAVLTDNQRLYMDWLCDPEREGTKEQQAERFGVAMSTLYRWTKMPVFRSEWDKRVEDLAGDPDRLQEVYDKLYREALKGNIKAAELYLKAIGKLNQKTEVEITRTAAEMTDEELEEYIAQAAAAELTQRRLEVVK